MEKNLIEENNIRVEILYKKHYNQLRNYAMYLTKDEQEAEDLVQNLILSLLEKVNQKLWYKDSFNLHYLTKVIKSKFVDRVKVINQTTEYNYNYDGPDDVYDTDKDLEEELLTNLYIATVNETKTLNIDKYADLYIKHKLYGLSITNCIKLSGKKKGTIYIHFKLLNKWVLDTYTKKAEKIYENVLN